MLWSWAVLRTFIETVDTLGVGALSLNYNAASNWRGRVCSKFEHAGGFHDSFQM
jgi:hypothetical protein